MKKYLFYIATAVYLITAVVFLMVDLGAAYNYLFWLVAALLGVWCACVRERTCRIVAWALAVSALGDVLGGQWLLLPQIGAFAIAQVLYAVAFAGLARWNVRRLPLLALPLTIAVVAAVKIVPAVSGVMQWAIVGYMCLIMSMGVCAVFVKMKGWWCVTVGSLLFMLSDSIIAWNIFVERVPHAGVLIMSTYYAAQGLMSLAILRRGLAVCEGVSDNVA